jgi:hypothetical protein
VRPDQPAIVILGHFSPQIVDAYGFSGPEVMHSVVAQFYDVPHVSIKPELYPAYIAKPDSIRVFFADDVLANSLGHELIADALIHYFQTQVCAAWKVATGESFEAVSPLFAGSGNSEEGGKDAPLMDKHGVFGGLGNHLFDGKGAGAAAADSQKYNPHLHVPVGRVAAAPDEVRRASEEEVAPFCVSANDLINPLPLSLFAGSGWTAHHPAGPGGGGGPVAHGHYWASAQPTSRLRIPIQVGAGDIAVYYLQSPYSSDDPGSAVQCWVDDNTDGARLLVNRAEIGETQPVYVFLFCS